ncbi:unnamed protein product [Choristocarpus tenellus]
MDLGTALSEFYSVATPNEKKHQIEKGLHDFRTLPNVHLVCLDLLKEAGQGRGQQELYLLHFVGCTLEDVIRRRWGTVPLQERLHVRRFLFEVDLRINELEYCLRQNGIYADTILQP